MGAATAAQVAGRNPKNFKIVCENFDQIVAANMAKGGFIAGISSQRPFDQGVAEATAGALALIDVAVPTYIVVPPQAVDRQNLPEAYQAVYHVPLPEKLLADLKNSGPR